MLRNPEKRANIKALAAHFHLIEEKGAAIAMEEPADPSDDDHDRDDRDEEDGRQHDDYGLPGHGGAYGDPHRGDDDGHRGRWDGHRGGGYGDAYGDARAHGGGGGGPLAI